VRVYRIKLAPGESLPAHRAFVRVDRGDRRRRNRGG
jgi:hypothetical protein